MSSQPKGAWEFAMDMKPTPLMRPRVTRRVTYNPQHNLMHCVAQEIKQVHWRKPPLDGDVEIHWKFSFAMPSGWSEKKKKTMAGRRRSSRPDASNLIKFYEDCMNGIVFNDDSQLTDGSFSKRYWWDNQIEIKVIHHGRD